MDGSRFDAIARRLGEKGSRRGLMKAAIGIGVGAATVGILANDSDAVLACRVGLNSCTNNSQCCSGECNPSTADRRIRNRCTCEPDAVTCGLECCRNGALCVDGICRSFTPTPTNTPTSTNTPTPTETNTPTETSTPVTPTETNTPTETSTPVTPTETNTPTETATLTPTRPPS